MRRRERWVIGAVLVTGGIIAACGPRRIERSVGGEIAEPAAANLRAWPNASRNAAVALIARYGQPAEQAPSMLIWYDVGPWKRTVLHRDPIRHAFPREHMDLLEQTIDYRVPLDKVDDLVAFDGSLLIDRTKGELSTRCDQEAMNFLALNIADEIATSRSTVEDGRLIAAREAAAFAANRFAPYTEGLQFRVPIGDKRDPDTPLIPGRPGS